MSERKTEGIVRNHFSLFLDQVTVEEQRPDNAKINKLLKKASTKGMGQGYPEFIITYKINPDFLIVVERGYNYGRQANKTLKNILLPSKINNEFADSILLKSMKNICLMEKYIRKIHIE